MVLMQKNAQQAQLTMKMTQEMGVSQNHINSVINPFSGGNSQNSFMLNRLQSQEEQSSFFNRKVYKPIRGGG